MSSRPIAPRLHGLCLILLVPFLLPSVAGAAGRMTEAALKGDVKTIDKMLGRNPEELNAGAPAKRKQAAGLGMRDRGSRSSITAAPLRRMRAHPVSPKSSRNGADHDARFAASRRLRISGPASSRYRAGTSIRLSRARVLGEIGSPEPKHPQSASIPRK